MKQFYTYTFFEGDTPLYVGKGHGRRAFVHFRHRKHAFKPIACQLKSLVDAKKPFRIVFEAAVDEAAAFAREKELVARYGRRDLGTGHLFNLTDGGDGTAGRKMPEHEKQQRSLAQKGKPKTAEHAANIKAGAAKKILPDDFGARISAAKKGKPLSEAHRLAISRGQRKRWST